MPPCCPHLEASYIGFRLPPSRVNFGKRLVKMPKLSFLDTGLANWLLGINDAAAMNLHPMRGALLQNMLVGEYVQHLRHRGLAHMPYFWRDNIGHETDLLVDVLWPLEVQSGATFQPEWLRGLHTWVQHAAAARQGQGMLIRAAPGHFEAGGVMAAHWRDALLALGAAPAQPA